MVSLPIVLLIFISSNQPNENLMNLYPTSIDSKANTGGRWKEGNARNLQSLVNDLTAVNVPFMPDNSKQVIKEVVKAREEKAAKEQGPVPLYSLVKNGCEQGYVMDQNGVCQKAIVQRSEKKFDSERRRRKRFVDDGQELSGRRNAIPFFEHFNKPFPYRKLIEKLKGNGKLDCGKIYPGLIPNGADACKKSVTVKEFKKFKKFSLSTGI